MKMKSSTDESREVAREFLRRLENDELKKEHLPNQGFEFTEESVQKELERYHEFLQSDFFKEICEAR